MADLNCTDPSDRRSAARHDVCLEAVALFTGSQQPERVEGRVLNLSETGMMFAAANRLPEKLPIALEVQATGTRSRYQVIARVAWVNDSRDDGNVMYGLAIRDILNENGEGASTLKTLIQSTQVRERRASSDLRFPLRRRADDYSEYQQNPFLAFLKTLQKVAASTSPIRNIVIADELLYLKKRVRHLFPDPRIMPASAIDEGLDERTLVILNFNNRRRHERYSLIDFEEYLLKSNGRSAPLSVLAAVSRACKENATIRFVSSSPFSDQSLVSKYLTVSKFKDVSFVDGHLLEASKRPLLRLLVNRGRQAIEEVESPAVIGEVQDFAAEVFSSDFNFSKEIDDLFSDHSDFYLVRDERDGRIINFARVTWHLPAHLLPCMLAVKRGTDLHLHLGDADHISYGEVFSPYINSLSAAKTYPDLVKVILRYGEDDRINVMFTTYSSHDESAGKFFSKYFGFQDSKITLTYGTFGGNWRLVYCSRESFRKSVEMNFVSREEHSKLINPFL